MAEDRRVTLVMIGTERDGVVEVLAALFNSFGGVRALTDEQCRTLEHHRDRLRQARTGSWGKR